MHVDPGLFGMVGLAVGWVRATGRDDGAFVPPDQWLPAAPDPDPAAGAAALLAEVAALRGAGLADVDVG